MSTWPKEIPFSDAEIDKLLEKPIEQQTGSFSANPPPDLASALAVSPFSAYSFSYRTPYFNDYYRLLRTGSDEGLQKLMRRNTSLAVAFFPSMCEHRRFAMVDWIIAEKTVDVNRMLPELVRFRIRYSCPEQADCRNRILAMLPEQKLTPYALHSCLVEICMPKGDMELFDVFFNDSRVDPSYNKNYALSLAALHGNKEIVLKLCADERVRACDDWKHVVYSACRQKDESILRTILDQPNAKFTRMALRAAAEEKHDWISQHPKYNAQLLVKKKPAALIRRAMELLEKYELDRTKRFLKVALSQLEGKEEKVGEVGEGEEYEESDDEEYEIN